MNFPCSLQSGMVEYTSCFPGQTYCLNVCWYSVLVCGRNVSNVRSGARFADVVRRT